MSQSRHLQMASKFCLRFAPALARIILYHSCLEPLHPLSPPSPIPSPPNPFAQTSQPSSLFLPTSPPSSPHGTCSFFTPAPSSRVLVPPFPAHLAPCAKRMFEYWAGCSCDGMGSLVQCSVVWYGMVYFSLRTEFSSIQFNSIQFTRDECCWPRSLGLPTQHV